MRATLTATRPQAVGALLRYFRDLDTAEEAYQDACLRALDAWPRNGPPRDPAAWLIFVGRNSTLDRVRRDSKLNALPDGAALSDLNDAESAVADRLDGYFHFHGARGAFLLQAGQPAEARHAFGRAIALARTPAQAAHIRAHLDRIATDAS